MRARSLLACLLVVSTVVGTRGQQQSTQPIGQPLPSAAARQFSQQLYESYQAQVDGMLFPPTAADPSGIAAVRGPDAPRIATQLLDPNGNAVSRPTVVGLLLTRDVYVQQLRHFADGLGQVRSGPVAVRQALADELAGPARELRAAWTAWHTPRPTFQYSTACGGAEAGRAVAQELERHQQTTTAGRAAFLRIVQSHPLLGIDGGRFYHALAGTSTPADRVRVLDNQLPRFRM